MKLQKLFEPRSIAIIGASRDKKKVGASVLTNLLAGGFKGRVYPVNPKASKIQGLRAYASISDIQGAIDLAIIAVPAQFVEDALLRCGLKKIPFAIIVTSGFGELGNTGKAAEERLRSLSKKYNITIVGPNCLGIVATGSKMNASFAGALPQSGGISCISQSGALMVSFIDWSRETRVGMRTLVSIGNQAGLTELELLEYLMHDPKTKVIGLYVEQISDGPAFMKVLARCARVKPVVVLKAGLSEAGVRAVSSHTGSLAGSAEVISALLAQAGAMQVYDIEDFFKLLELYSYDHRNPSHSVAVVTNAGGPGAITSDILSRTSLSLATLSEKTKATLTKLLPHGTSVANPIDLMGDADLDRFKNTLRRLNTDPSVGIIFVIVTPQRMTPANDIARYLGSLQRRTKKQVVACFIGGAMLHQARRILSEQKVLHFDYPYEALRVISLSKKKDTQTGVLPKNAASGKVLYTGEKSLMPYTLMQRLLAREGFPITKGDIITTQGQLRKIRTFPLALKVLSTKAIHKAAAGAVELDIPTRSSANSIAKRFLRDFKGEGFEGILAQRMVHGGREFIIGLKRDETAGMVLLFGIGGSFTEELNDTVLHIGAIDSMQAAYTLLKRIKHQRLLKGIDLEFVARLLKKLSDFGIRHPEVFELDFNPVKVYRKGGTIIDARIFVKSTK